MESILVIVNKLAAFGTVAFLAVAVLTAIFLILRIRNKLTDFLSKNILVIGLLISTGAAAMSIFYSDIIGFAPCFLCWFQRIFMYPLIPLFGLAISKKDRGIINYAFLLSILGFLVSIYHNLIYYFDIGALPCPANGPSCVQHFVSELGGLVSIPSMSFVMFLLLIVLILNAKRYNNSSRASMDGAHTRGDSGESHDFV